MQLTDRTSLRLVGAPGAGAGAHRCARPDEARKLSYPITLESGRAVHWRTVSEPEQARTPLEHYGGQSKERSHGSYSYSYVRNRWQQGTGHGVREGCVHVVVMHARLSDSEASAGQDNTSRAGFAAYRLKTRHSLFQVRIDVRVRAQQNTVQYSPRSTCTSVLVHRGELNYYNDP